MLFWVLLMLVIPYVVIRFRRDRDSRETATLVIILALAALFGVGATADFADANVGVIAYAGLSDGDLSLRDEIFSAASWTFASARGCSVELRSASLRLCSALNRAGT